MAFFKFRKNGDEQSGPTPAPESLDALRKRARHRLIGASALVLLGVVGFPLLFDSQPRPVAVDIAIDIPDKAKAPALTAPPASTPVAAAPAAVVASDAGPAVRASAPASANATAATATAVAGVAAVSALAAKPAATATAPASATATPESKAPTKPETKPEPKAAPKADVKPAPKVDDKAKSSNKAQALLDGKDAAKASAPGKRYAVQVGAFADDKKAHEARSTLEKAGIKTYTQVLTTADGKRTRVRVGPWENKAEADKAAEKIKKLNLPASVLEL